MTILRDIFTARNEVGGGGVWSWGSPIFRGGRGVSKFPGGEGLIHFFFNSNFFSQKFLLGAPPPPRIRSLSGRYASYWNAFLFQKCVSRILSTGGGGVCPIACWDPPEADPPGPQADTPHPTPPPTQSRPPQEQTHPSRCRQGSRHPRRSACWEIRAISGRYVSYWNAYMFNEWLICNPYNTNKEVC